MKEEWRPIKKYETLLEVSNLGRIRRRQRVETYSNGAKHLYKEKILKGGKQSSGYKNVRTSIGGLKINISVHRAVAEAFLENPQGHPFINHKDENPSNNCVENLEWCTPKYNANYGTSPNRIRKWRIDNGLNVPVIQYDGEGNVVAEFQTLKDAAKSINVTPTTIANCCNGISSSANGYIYRFKGEKFVPRTAKRILRTFVVFKDNKELCRATSVTKLCSIMKFSIGSFRRICNGTRKQNRKLKDYTIIALPFNGDNGFIIKNSIKYENYKRTVI